MTPAGAGAGGADRRPRRRLALAPASPMAASPPGSPASEPDFFAKVWAVVARIPPGRVTTYGHLARHLGSARSSRAVGYALKAVVRSDAWAGGGPLAVPCHRVVNRDGALTGRLHFETPTAMEERLRAEGVAFLPDGRVDLARHLWTPDAP